MHVLKLFQSKLISYDKIFVEIPSNTIFDLHAIGVKFWSYKIKKEKEDEAGYRWNIIIAFWYLALSSNGA